jgi:enoyl-CoA hydratase/carnithine racemase
MVIVYLFSISKDRSQTFNGISMTFIHRQTMGSLEVWRISRRDRLNAIGPSIAFELLQYCREITTRTEPLRQSTSVLGEAPRALAIHAEPVPAASGKIWIAGGDLKELATYNQTQAREYAGAMQEVCQLLEDLAIPVVMSLDGSAIGGGAEFYLAGDIRLATRDSMLDFRQLKVGLPCGFGGTARLSRLVGHAHAQRLLLTTAKIDAHQASTLGIAHTLFDNSDECIKHARHQAEEWSLLSPQAIAAQKRMLRQALPLHATQQNLSDFVSVWRNPAHQNFLDSFTKS